VTAWQRKTPPDFVFAAKAPQSITHEKVLIDCEAEFGEFMHTMDILGEKLGPLVFQFSRFDRWKFAKQEDFLAVLTPFLKKLPANHKFAIEMRNKTWLNAVFADLLREYKIVLVLQDLSFMPRPWEYKEQIDFVTTNFVYVLAWGSKGHRRADHDLGQNGR
jgi:uncharacterized protein YecE (DUF72 family)